MLPPSHAIAVDIIVPKQNKQTIISNPKNVLTVGFHGALYSFPSNRSQTIPLNHLWPLISSSPPFSCPRRKPAFGLRSFRIKSITVLLMPAQICRHKTSVICLAQGSTIQLLHQPSGKFKTRWEFTIFTKMRDWSGSTKGVALQSNHIKVSNVRKEWVDPGLLSSEQRCVTVRTRTAVRKLKYRGPSGRRPNCAHAKALVQEQGTYTKETAAVQSEKPWPHTCTG